MIPITIHFPDISAFQAGISLAGVPAVIIKVTEGTGWLSGDFAPAVGRAGRAGAWPAAYHFLHQGNGAGQAAWCRAHHAGLPVMCDFEPAGTSHPGIGDATAFIDAFRKAGGQCNLLYLPHWYWQQIGSPSLKPFTDRHMALVSSAYTTYSDTGPGWAGYGSMTPAVWQHSSTQLLNGRRVDYNAFKGTLAGFRQIATGGQAADPNPTVQQGDSGPGVTKAQQRLNAWGAARPAMAVDGQFGPTTLAAARQFQKTHGLTVDGVIGPGTWAKLNASTTPPAPPASKPPAAGARYHGPWVSAGQQSLAGLARQLGVSPNGLVRMTAVHYGTLGDQLGGYVGGLAAGTVQHTAPLPKGTIVWAD